MYLLLGNDVYTHLYYDCLLKVETNDGITVLSTNVNSGISETEFKSKYNNHIKSFRNWTHENDFELSKFIGSLKDQIKEFDVKCSIFKKSSRSTLCNLCLLKKLIISNFEEKKRLLSKWLDLVSKYRHENKYLLINYWLNLLYL